MKSFNTVWQAAHIKRGKSRFLIALFVILLSLACTIGYEGVSISDDPEPSNPIQEFIQEQTLTAQFGATEEGESAPTPEPEYRPVESRAGSEAERVNTGSHEYAVNATNFDCICQVDGNVNSTFTFTGNQLDLNGKIYDKIDENRYKLSFMGYYILNSGSGDAVTSTVVEEEKHVIIILTGSGYVMEHYSGDTSSPCCYHTFTIEK
jgi:hypothetical protein